MEKNYTMEEILKLFYDQVLIKNNPNIPEIIDKNQEFVNKHQEIVAIEKQNYATANSGLDSLPNFTANEKEYIKAIRNSAFDYNQVFDLIPIAAYLKGIDISRVYIKNEDGTLKDLSTNVPIDKAEIYQNGGNCLIIAPSYNDNLRNYYRFTIIGKEKGMSAVMDLRPKQLEKAIMPCTAICAQTLITLDSQKNLYMDNGYPKMYPQDNYFSPANAEEFNKKLYNYMLNIPTLRTPADNKFLESINDLYPGANYFNNLSVDRKNILGKLCLERTQNTIDASTYYNMLYQSEDVQSLYRNLSYVPVDEDGFRRFSISGSFKEEIEKNKLTPEELNFIYSISSMPQTKLEEHQNTIESKTQDISTNQNSKETNEPILGSQPSKSSEQIIKEGQGLEMLRNAGIPLSPEQEQIIFISGKLQSEEFKEYQAKRQERLQKQQELRDKIQKENEAKENWQNSPEHPNNLSQNRLEAWKKELVALEQVYAINPSLLTEEQINYISKIKETIEMYTQEKEREHEIDTGMSNESQNWYQEHYTGMKR